MNDNDFYDKCKLNPIDDDEFLFKYSSKIYKVRTLQRKFRKSFDTFQNQRINKRKSLEQNKAEIEDIVRKKGGTIIGQRWKKIKNREYPYFKIKCSEGHEFEVSKYTLKGTSSRPKGSWCPHPDCKSRSSNRMTLDEHRAEIEDIVKKKGGTIIGQRWKKIKNREYPYFKIKCSEGHEFEVSKYHLKGMPSKLNGTWCPDCIGKSLDEHKADIENIVAKKEGKIIGQRWYERENRKEPEFQIECKEGHTWWVLKYNLMSSPSKPESSWCPYCRGKSLDEHRSDITSIVKLKGGEIIDQKWIRKKWQGKHFKLPKFYIKCDKGHKWWAGKNKLNCTPSNPQGSWCPICSARIKAIGNFGHVPIEYITLKYLNSKNCTSFFEKTLEEGTIPDLIINRDSAFTNKIEVNQIFFSYPHGIVVRRITIDLTMSLSINYILAKCFKGYQNDSTLLLIVLMREENFATAKYFQNLINNQSSINNNDKKRIKVINFNEFLDFLGLSNWNHKKTTKDKKFVSFLQNIITLCNKCIHSDSDFEKLVELSDKSACKLADLDL